MSEYKKQLDQVWQSLKEEECLVLATSVNDMPTARTINVIYHNKRIYFQTDSRMKKADDIRTNDHVALSIGKYQIQGTCRELGHPHEDKNKWFAIMYKKAFPSAFAKYSGLPNEQVYEVIPTVIKVWHYHNSIASVTSFILEKKLLDVHLYR